MFGFEPSQIWAVAIGLVVFGVLLIAGGIAVAATLVDWKAIKELRAKGKAEKTAPAEPAT